MLKRMTFIFLVATLFFVVAVPSAWAQEGEGDDAPATDAEGEMGIDAESDIVGETEALEAEEAESSAQGAGPIIVMLGLAALFAVGFFYSSRGEDDSTTPKPTAAESS